MFQRPKRRIDNMDCPTKEALIRARIGALPGVLALEFNLMQRTLTSHHHAGLLPTIVQAVASLGFAAQVEDKPAAESSVSGAPPPVPWWSLVLALALIAVADTLKGSSREAVRELHALGIRTVMLTGDNLATARTIAAQAGIDQVHGDLLTVEKQRAIEQLAQAPAGDGINDAPALACADIGFAMPAAGTDTAIETADVSIMDDDLRKVPAFVRLSRATVRVLRQNIALALGIEAVFRALRVTGETTLWMAVFADMGARLQVVGNGLRLLRR